MRNNTPLPNSTNPVGCVPLQYDAFKKRDPETYTAAHIYREVAAAGYSGVPAGPYSTDDPQAVVAELAGYGLLPAPAYMPGGEPWKPANRAAMAEKARRFAAFAAAVGVQECFVDSDGWGYHTKTGQTRPEIAGRVTDADGLTDDEFKHLAETLNAVGEAMRAEGGVRACLHNHVGTVIETETEYERILAMTDPATLWAGLDTGHLAWAGGDVEAFVERHATRIAGVHLKDIHRVVRERGVSEGWKYGTFTANGLFAELGEGMIDFGRVLRTLSGTGYAGWLLVETDVTTKPTPRESLETSRAALRTLGY